MKNFFLAAVALLLFVSCKDKENQEQQEEITFNTTESIGSLPAKLDGNKAAAIKKIWNKELGATGIPSEIEVLEIISLTVTSNEAAFKATPQYAIKAVTKDNKTTLTALLVVKGNQFYLDEGTATIICSSECNVPCEPLAIYKNGRIFLKCAGCADCVKTDFML
jgi:hypothetical protein